VNRLKSITDRLRLEADLWLHRHGPWWLLLAGAIGALLALALLVMPGMEAELAAKRAVLAEIQMRLADSRVVSAPMALPAAESALHYEAFREMLTDEKEVLPRIKAVLDLAVAHRLISTRAEYVRSVNANAQAETLQMTLPVKGRYIDLRRWIEDILRRYANVAVNELAFKRDEVAVNQVEAKVRLTIWYRRSSSADDGRRNAAEASDP